MQCAEVAVAFCLGFLIPGCRVFIEFTKITRWQGNKTKILGHFSHGQSDYTERRTHLLTSNVFSDHTVFKLQFVMSFIHITYHIKLLHGPKNYLVSYKVVR